MGGKRKSYRAASRRQRVLEDGTIEVGDLSDEEEVEDLQRKIARLRREAEEARLEYDGQMAAAAAAKGAADGAQAGPESLSKMLDEISRLPDAPAHTSGAMRAPQQPPAADDSPAYTVTYDATNEPMQPLVKAAADFDRRLVALEKAVGIGSSALFESDSAGLPRAVVPTLETLQKQISTLSEASTSSLDSISRRVRTLIQEADELEKSRKAAKAAQEALSQAGAAPADGARADDSEQTAKINALYGTLPTIENLTPLLPPLLDRLRSLRAMHANAATASEALDEIEKKQAEMSADIKLWRDGLDKIETAMGDGESAMAGNMKTMEGWVKELEQRAAKLGLASGQQGSQ